MVIKRSHHLHLLLPLQWFGMPGRWLMARWEANHQDPPKKHGITISMFNPTGLNLVWGGHPKPCIFANSQLLLCCPQLCHAVVGMVPLNLLFWELPFAGTWYHNVSPRGSCQSWGSQGVLGGLVIWWLCQPGLRAGRPKMGCPRVCPPSLVHAPHWPLVGGAPKPVFRPKSTSSPAQLPVLAQAGAS